MPLPRHLLRKPRVELDLGARGLPGCICLGRYNYQSARPGLPQHSHPQAFEICFLAKGRQSYEAGGERFALQGGDVFITQPGETHGTGSHPEEKGVLYWLQLTFRTGDGSHFLHLPKNRAEALRVAFQNLPSRHFHGGWRLQEPLDRIILLSQETESELVALAMTQLLVSFLLDLLAIATRKDARTRRTSLQPVVSYIETHLDQPLPIPLLAEISGLSEPRFKSSFKTWTGLPPGEYVLRAKIEKARQWLQNTDLSVTDIALRLGFSSSQYFATAFKRYTGRQPREVRSRP